MGVGDFERVELQFDRRREAFFDDAHLVLLEVEEETLDDFRILEELEAKLAPVLDAL